MEDLRYADDFVLIAGSIQELQELVKRVVSKSEKVGLFLNVDKTKVMKIETNSHSDESLVINGETVEEINHYYYLGATTTTSYDDSKEIRKRISIANNAVIALSYTWKSKSISLKTKKRLLNTLVFPVATYGSECWVVKQSDRHRLLRVSWTEHRTNNSILEQLNIKTTD